MEALKKFSEGQWFWNTANRLQALELWKEAVELDPDFAWAHASLGSYHYLYYNRPQGEFHFKKTLSLLDRLTEREKLWIVPQIESSRGNLEEAAKHYIIYLSRYPDDRSGWYNLGNQYMRMRQLDEALEAYGKALEVDPLHASSHINIATCFNMMENYEKAINHYERAFELSPDRTTDPGLNHEFGLVYVKMGELDKAREVYEKMLIEDKNKIARGNRSLALLCMFQGKYTLAMDHLKKAIQIREATKEFLNEMRNRLFLAAAYKAKGAKAAFRDELNSALAIQQQGYVDPWWLQIAWKLYIREGWLEEAETLLEKIESKIDEKNKSDRVVLNILQGEMALAQGSYDEAVEKLSLAYSEREDNYVLESLAYAHMKNEDWDKAISRYEELIIRKQIGWEAQEDWIQAHYHLGRIHEEKGEREKAIRYYQELIDIWKEADDDIPMLIDAKERMAELKQP